MFLPDSTIERIGAKMIAPFSPQLVNPASYDVTLSDHGIFKGQQVKLPYVLQPGDFILVSSEQYWRFPCDVAGQLLLKSTLGRSAINHMLAGWFDPDFHGNATMELKNEGHEPYELKPGARVAQMVFYGSEPVSRPYRFKGRYHGQKDVTAARKEGRSATLDNSPLWVAGPFHGTPVKQYEQWFTHIEQLLAKNPGLGTVDVHAFVERTCL